MRRRNIIIAVIVGSIILFCCLGGLLSIRIRPGPPPPRHTPTYSSPSPSLSPTPSPSPSLPPSPSPSPTEGLLIEQQGRGSDTITLPRPLISFTVEYSFDCINTPPEYGTFSMRAANEPKEIILPSVEGGEGRGRRVVRLNNSVSLIRVFTTCLWEVKILETP